MNREELDAYRAKKAAAGRLGGLKTVETHGREHMSAIGKVGFAKLATYARGGRAGAFAILMNRGSITPRRPVVELTVSATRELCREVGLSEIPWTPEG